MTYCHCHGTHIAPPGCPTPVRCRICGWLSALGWALINLSVRIARTTHKKGGAK